MSLLTLYRRLDEEIKANIDNVEVVSIENEDLLDADTNFLAFSFEPVLDGSYKSRIKKHETPLFINCYCSSQKGVDAKKVCQTLRQDIIDLLDEKDLSSSYIKIYKLKWESSSPLPAYNKENKMWYATAKFIIRWSEVG